MDTIKINSRHISEFPNGITINKTNVTKEATFVVAASDSLHKEQADYTCDGVSDQVEIQAAIDTAPSGSKIYLMEGTFHIGSSILINKKITFEGSGIGVSIGGGTTIKLDANSNCDMIRVDGGGTHIYFPQFKNFYLYGNRTNQTSGHGINFVADLSDTITENLFIHECKEDGIHAEAGWYMRYTHVWSEFNGGAGWNINEGWLTSCVTSENYGAGIVCNLQTPGQIHLMNTRVKRNALDGVLIYGWTQRACTIIGCEIISNSYTNAGTYSGIYIWGSGDTFFRGFVISNNVIGNPDGTGTDQKYAIQMNRCTGVIISDNALVTEHTGIIFNELAGADNIIRNNLGYVTENSGTDTITSATTSKVVTHGLSVTPAAGDIMVTPMESLGNASFFWIDTYTSTQFTINTNVAPGADTDFAWRAIVL